MATQRYIYLDYNATAPLLPAVKEHLCTLLEEETGNPSSIHQLGKHAKNRLTKARHILGEYVKADPSYIIFTSSGTEANNQALRGVDWDHIFISAIEHDSVDKAVSQRQVIPVDDQGLIDLKVLEQRLKEHQGQNNLVSVMWANNETGVIQPIEEIAKIAHRYGAFFHTDAVQVIGKLPIDFQAMDVDMMTVAAHKFGGPRGVGALIVKETVPLTAFIRGGGQEKNRRAGTENVMAISGFGVALENAPALSHLKEWQQTLEQKLLSKPQAYIFSYKAPRLFNTTCIAIPSVANMTQVMRLDLEKIAVSAGAACSSGRVQTSRILKAMCRDDRYAAAAIRISYGWQTRLDDLKHFTNSWKTMYDDCDKRRSAS